MGEEFHQRGARVQKGEELGHVQRRGRRFIVQRSQIWRGAKFAPRQIILHNARFVRLHICLAKR